MPDRVIRDELLESERWLDLPTDTDRLAFIGLRLRSDDFGNIEAGPRRMFRFFHQFTQIKTEEGAAVVLGNLAEADMIRLYRAGEPERDFIHLPRSRPSGSYLVRKCPPSPWCDTTIELGKHVRLIRNQGLAKNVPRTSQKRNGDVLQGVGVGVGEGKTPLSNKLDGVAGFTEFWTAYPRKEAKQNAIKAWNKLKPDDRLQVSIAHALVTAKASEQWRKDGGKFIPHAASWINGKRWNDQTAEKLPEPSRMGKFVI